MVTSITNELLRSCIQLDVGSVERLDERKRVMLLKKVTHLVFSFKDLRAIDHLDGLTFLEKLHLDNNSLCKIENLSHFLNLTILDLSFNKLEKIEGLESLKNLDDLSLYCNQIKHLEGLDNLQRLTSLSLGKNLLQSLEEILYLRRLNSLQLLTLDGNPLCKDQDYRTYVIGHLRELRFLDHRVVDEASLLAAREQYQDEMLEVKQKEADEEVVIKAAQTKASQQELFKVFLEIQNDPSIGEDRLRRLLEANEKLNEKLLELEMLSVGEIQDLWSKFEDNYSVLVENCRLHFQNHFATMRMLENKFSESVAAQAVSVMEQFAMSDSYDDLENEEARMLIHDKDLMNNCIQASHDSHTLKIDISEDQTLSNEEKMYKAINETFQQEEIRRNRERVEEILFVVNINEKEINDKLSDYVESP